MSEKTDIRMLQIGEQLLPGYIQRALDNGLITAEEAAAARETDALVELTQLSENRGSARS